MQESLRVAEESGRRSAKGMKGGGELLPQLQRTVGSVGVYSLSGPLGFLFRSKMAVDADGAPNAYHPTSNRLALDYLANAGKPGNWWGVVTDTGESNGTPVVQKASDPCPGYYVSATSLQDKSRGRTDPRRYVDSASIPYVALPREMKELGMQLGDLAVVVHAKSGALCFAIFADVGPKGKLGECSVALAKALGVPSSPKNGGTERSEIIYLTFPGSSIGWPLSVEQLSIRAQEMFEAWGGMDQLRSCFTNGDLTGTIRQTGKSPAKGSGRKGSRIGAAPVAVNKIIVTNLGALTAKYGTKVEQVRFAISELMAADEARGLSVRLVALDSPTDMKEIHAKPAKLGDPRTTKRAIDAVYKALQPEYLLIVGGPDVVPFQPLRNPCHSADGDDDPVVPSDLPYACSASYGTDPNRFLGPTRIVGRLPDLPGESDPKFLIKLLRTSAHWTERERGEYQRYFALSAAVWKDSTKHSVSTVFGSSKQMKTVPPYGPEWPAEDLGRKMHFINCHGSPSDTRFYGQHGEEYPVAEIANDLAAKISEGTVVAAECCYGGQVFAPSDTNGQAGICLTYLDNGAYAFLGSSTIAYGPSEGNGQADLLCQYFVESVLGGASTGRALIEARHRFAAAYAHLDPTDLKTIAQFCLLGDPSIRPVKPATHAFSHTKVYQQALGKGEEGARVLRRERITRTGANLHQTLGSVIEHATEPPAHVIQLLEAAASEVGMQAVSHKSFAVKFPAAANRGELRQYSERRKARMVHMAAGRVNIKGSKEPTHIVTLVATVEEGMVVHLRRVHSR